MKLTIAALAFLLSSQAFSMEFVLNCRPSIKTANKSAVYQVVKSAFQSGEEWITRYTVRAMGPAYSFGPKTFETQAAGSGDQDYTEYNVVDPDNSSGLKSINVQNRFAWVTLINTKGEEAYNCRPHYN